MGMPLLFYPDGDQVIPTYYPLRYNEVVKAHVDELRQSINPARELQLTSGVNDKTEVD